MCTDPKVNLVSILIPCFNTEQWIACAIESALAQTWPEKEIVVVDDGSTDRSADIIRSFGDRIRYEIGAHQGGNPARNRLLELARGEWVQYLDADDYLLPDKIEKQMGFLKLHPETDIVFGPRTVEWWTHQCCRRKTYRIPAIDDDWVLLARIELPATSSPMWRRSAIFDVGGWKPDQPVCQEFELYSRMLMAGKRFAYCSSGGAIHRRWTTNSLYQRNRHEAHRQITIIEQRIETFLRTRGQLTEARKQAINEARLATARGAWKFNPRFSMNVIDSIFCSQPQFKSRRGGAPWPYRMLFNALGFRAAQRIADGKQAVISRLHGLVPRQC